MSTSKDENGEGGYVSSVKYYVLNNENANEFFDEWKFKTMAIIRKKGWSKPFDEPKTDIPSATEAADASATDATKEMYKANAEAFDQILMGCSGVPLGMVRRAGDDAREAMKLLTTKYGRTAKTSWTATLQEFVECKLEDTGKDPDEWFMQLDAINERLVAMDKVYKKEPYEIKSHMLNSLPQGYEDVRTKVSGNEDVMDIVDIESEIREKWKRDFMKDSSDKGKNYALYGEQKGKGPKKRFKGKCRKCGKQGHKASECRSDKKGVCFECGEDGHFARDCPKKTGNSDNNQSNFGGMFVGMITQEAYSVGGKGTTGNHEEFLLDSGATCHVISDSKCLTDVSDTNEVLVIGDKSSMKAVKTGTLTLKTPDNVTLKLTDTKVVPGIAKNIISVGRIADAGNDVHLSGKVMTITNKNGSKLSIERDSKSTLFHVKGTRVNEDPEVPKQSANPAVKKISVDINDAHELYGHVSEGPLRDILKRRNYVVIGSRKSCEPCAYAKAKAKAVGKTLKIVAEEKGQRLYMDSSGPYKMSMVGSKYWILVVDDKTRKAWSFFVKNKSDIKKVFAALVVLLKGARIVTKYLRCDNAGENVKGLKEVCTEHGITMELTAPNTPQQNGVVERKFVTIRDRAQAMMLGAKLDEEHQGTMWAEAVHCATKLANAVPGIHKDSPDFQWYGEDPKFLDHLVRWGTIGYVTIRTKKPKLTPKSVKMVFVGYADDHAGNTYRMYNPETKRVVLSRDVTWAEWHGSQDVPESLKMFANDPVDLADDQIGEERATGEELNKTGQGNPHVIPDDEHELERTRTKSVRYAPELETVVGDGNREPETLSKTLHPKSTRFQREMARLRTSYNPTTVEGTTNVVEDEPEPDPNAPVEVHFVYNVELASDPGEPKNYGEALQSPEKLHWLGGIRKEIENFLKRKVWNSRPLSELKPGQKPIQTKWIFKKKHEQDGSIRYKGRVVVRGFVMIPGIDFTQTFSPVATDVSVKVILCIVLYMDGWEAHMVDVEAAFLEAALEEDVYIEWPEGLVELGYVTKNETIGTCLKLEKAMYGCVQSPRAFYKELTKKLSKMGLVQSAADPCLWYKVENDKLVLFIAVYVDDIVVAGKRSAINWFKNEIQTRFKISDLGVLKKHLGVWYERKTDSAGEHFELSMTKYQDDIGGSQCFFDRSVSGLIRPRICRSSN